MELSWTQPWGQGEEETWEGHLLCTPHTPQLGAPPRPLPPPSRLPSQENPALQQPCVEVGGSRLAQGLGFGTARPVVRPWLGHFLCGSGQATPPLSFLTCPKATKPVLRAFGEDKMNQHL